MGQQAELSQELPNITNPTQPVTRAWYTKISEHKCLSDAIINPHCSCGLSINQSMLSGVIFLFVIPSISLNCFTTGSGKCAPCVLAMTIMIQIDCSCIDVCLSGSSSCILNE